MRDYVICVVGVPLSGTSMTMRMLQFGGVPIIHKNTPPTTKHPYGVFETNVDTVNLGNSLGSGVKVIGPQLLYALPTLKYKIIMPVRDAQQVALSRTAGKQSLDILTKRVNDSMNLINFILKNRTDVDVLQIPYADYFNQTADVATRIKNHLTDGDFNDVLAATAVDPKLYNVYPVPSPITPAPVITPTS